MNTKIENIAYFGLTKEFDDLYNNSNDVPLYVIQAVHHKNPMNYRQSMSIYSVKGRCAISAKNKQ